MATASHIAKTKSDKVGDGMSSELPMDNTGQVIE
jgi:hypothetical protein